MARSAVVDLRLWGKERGLGGARYPVVCHGLDAAAAVRVLWSEFVSPGVRRRCSAALGVSEAEACALVAFWAALHDIGKISPPFACRLEMPPEFGTGDGVRLGHDEAAGLVGWTRRGPRNRWCWPIGWSVGADRRCISAGYARFP